MEIEKWKRGGLYWECGEDNYGEKAMPLWHYESWHDTMYRSGEGQKRPAAIRADRTADPSMSDITKFRNRNNWNKEDTVRDKRPGEHRTG